MFESDPLAPITQLLQAWSEGDASALETLTPLVYGELHRIANGLFAAHGAPKDIQPTALISEFFLKLIKSKPQKWPNRRMFFASASRQMRQILADLARKRRSLKRGSGQPDLPLDEHRDGDGEPPRALDLLVLDDCLERLRARDPQQATIVELRFFWGLSWDEIADLLEVSVRTARAKWALARVWLYSQMRGGDDCEGPLD